MKLTRAQFPEERNSFRRSNGETKITSISIRKQYQGETDWMPENWHQRLTIALAHDNVFYEGEKHVGGIVKDGDYTINWQDFLDYPTAKAEFTVQVTPFDATNANCQSCAEAVQLSLNDDTFPDPLAEGQTYDLDIPANDSICCYPSVFSITAYNSDYLAAASIDPVTGILSVTLKTGLVEVNGLNLLTYRVTCPNGSYDEADVFGNVAGTIAGCLAPTNLTSGSVGSYSISFDWGAPAAVPANGYDYDIRAASAPGVILFSGNTSLLTVNISGLDPDTEYIFNLNANCGGDISNIITTNQSTIPATTSCGLYEVLFNNGSGDPSQSANFRVTGCDGQQDIYTIFNLGSRLVCARQTSPNVGVKLIGPSGLTFTYDSPC